MYVIPSYGCMCHVTVIVFWRDLKWRCCGYYCLREYFTVSLLAISAVLPAQY